MVGYNFSTIITCFMKIMKTFYVTYLISNVKICTSKNIYEKKFLSVSISFTKKFKLRIYYTKDTYPIKNFSFTKISSLQ